MLDKFYKSLDKGSADYLDSITGGVPLQKFPVDVNKILDYITEYTSLLAESDPLREECDSMREDFLVTEHNPLSSTSLDSALESSPEPGTSEEEEIRLPLFSSRFEDDPSRNSRNTSNLFNAHLGKEISSAQMPHPQTLWQNHPLFMNQLKR